MTVDEPTVVDAEAVLGERLDVAPYAAAEYVRAQEVIAAKVAQIDALRAERDQALAERDQALVEFGALVAENTSLKTALGRERARSALVNADYDDLRADFNREAASPRRPAVSREQSPLMALLTSDTARKIFAQAAKAFAAQASARPQPPVGVDGRAGDVEPVLAPGAPSPARHPETSGRSEIRAHSRSDRPAPSVTQSAGGNGTPQSAGAGHPGEGEGC